MKQEHADYLIAKFPELYVDSKKRSLSFEIGDGWFNIIHGLSSAIQSHIDWANKQADDADEWNAMVAAGQKPDWWGDRASMPEPKTVPERVEQVVAAQVKEKFGTLRFYVNGGGETVDNFIRVAEHMSAVTCEECGAPGEIIRGGWIRVLCPVCEAKMKAERGETDED